MSRRVLLLAHRWIGLALALFLLPVALTGSALVWKTELDAALNPQLFRAPPSRGPVLTEKAIARALEARYPPVRVAFVDLPLQPGQSARAQVRNWPQSRPPERVYNEVFVDPVTAQLLGARSTTTPSPIRSEFVPWLRRLHYTLLLQRTGMLILGGVAIVWLLDCFVGAALTLPRQLERWRKWKIAWQVRTTRLNFDLHRATGLWLWPVLVVLALTSIYLNLPHEVFVPVVEKLLAPLPQRWRDPLQSAILELQYPLHTGEALGIAGRILVFLTGLAIAAMAVTGIVSSIRKLLWVRGWR